MKIWRGDQDAGGVRQTRASIPTCDGLFSNMIAGGNPFALSQQSFVASIHKHVVPGWNTTHFLSFSKSRKRAEAFAIGHSGKRLMSSGPDAWDTIVAETELSGMSLIQTMAVGIEHYRFNEITTNHLLFQQQVWNAFALQQAIMNRRSAGIPTVRNILVIDVEAHLLHLQRMGVQVDPRAIAYAHGDEEILVLPVDPLWGHVGNTALLDMGAFSSIEFFRLV